MHSDLPDSLPLYEKYPAASRVSKETYGLVFTGFLKGIPERAV